MQRWITERVANATVRSGGIALAFVSGAQDVEADAVEMLAAHVGDAGFDHRVKVLGAAVVLELLAPLVSRLGSCQERDAVSPRHHRHGIDEHRR